MADINYNALPEKTTPSVSWDKVLITDSEDWNIVKIQEALQFKWPQGDIWNTWVWIASITLISTVWKIKTYRITYTDTTTFDFIVTDWADWIWDMLKSDNLSWLANYATARTNLWLNTTANQTDSTNKRYVTDAQLTVIWNTSWTNTWDNAPNTNTWLVHTAWAETIWGVKTFSDNLIASSNVWIGTTSPWAKLDVNWNILQNWQTVWEPDFYKYNIVTSVASWNLTVALKNFEWNDPTTTKPVKVQIGWVIRTITSALSYTEIVWQNYYNLWSAELATKEVDLFVYLCQDTLVNTITIAWARIPYWITKADFDFSWFDREKWLNTVNNTSTDKVVNIGRFNAILSATYDWSIPATSVIINRPVFETRKLEYIPQFSNSILSWYNYAYYQIISNRMYVWFNADNRTFTSWSWSASVSLPFSPNGAIPKIIYTLGNSSSRPYNTYMTQISSWKINFWQGNDFTWFAWSETSIYLKFDDTLPL